MIRATAFLLLALCFGCTCSEPVEDEAVPAVRADPADDPDEDEDELEEPDEDEAEYVD